MDTNNLQPAPVVLVNVLDPKKHIEKVSAEEKTITEGTVVLFLDGSVAIRFRVDSELSDEARFRVRGV